MQVVAESKELDSTSKSNVYTATLDTEIDMQTLTAVAPTAASSMEPSFIKLMLALLQDKVAVANVQETYAKAYAVSVGM